MTPPIPATLRLRWFGFATLLGAACFAAHLAHAGLAREDVAREAILPDPDSLRFLTGSHRCAVADLYWLHLVQYVGATALDPVPWPQLEALAELVTTLDPDYGFAYEASGILLSEAGRIQASNEILYKGMENVPDRWQLPFFAAFNHWHHLGELKEGAELLLRTSRIPGSPRHSAELSSRLYSSAGDVEQGLSLIEMMLAAGSSPMIQQELERQRDKLLVERALQQVEAALRRFEAEHGRLPSGLEELRSGELRELLASEIGASIQWTPGEGTVRSPLLPERLVLYRPPVDGVPAALARPEEP